MMEMANPSPCGLGRTYNNGNKYRRSYIDNFIQAAELQVYRTHIDEKAVIGIDTAAAEAKINEAKQKIDSARLAPQISILLH